MSDSIVRLKSAVALIDLVAAGIAFIDLVTFQDDQLLIDATAFRVMHIGEAVIDLPPELKQRHPALPWQRIVGMRNRLAHDYTGMNLALIWRTVRDHLDELRSACLAELDANQNSGD